MLLQGEDLVMRCWSLLLSLFRVSRWDALLEIWGVSAVMTMDGDFWGCSDIFRRVFREQLIYTKLV